MLIVAVSSRFRLCLLYRFTFHQAFMLLVQTADVVCRKFHLTSLMTSLMVVSIAPHVVGGGAWQSAKGGVISTAVHIYEPLLLWL